VAYDTEGSGLFTDDGARVSACSLAWRDEDSGKIQALAIPFDQGTNGTFHGDGQAELPCGPKQLPASHAKRIGKWAPADLWAPNRTPREWTYLHEWLSKQKLVMHHKKYDCLMDWAGLRNRPGTAIDLMPCVVWDTQLFQGVIEPRESTSLKPTAIRLHLGVEEGIAPGAEGLEQEALAQWTGPKDDPRYDLIPWNTLSPYSRLDAVYTLKLYEYQQDWLSNAADAAKLRQLGRVDFDLAQVLYNMERRGVALDSEGLRGQAQTLHKMIGQAKEKVPFRATYPGAQKWFFGPSAEGGLGHLPYNDKLTKTGRPQVDEEVISRLVLDEAKGATEFQQFAELQSAASKWYDPWPALAGADGRIRTCHRQSHVVSGRLSVERWQAQAMPHDYQIPEGLVPPKAYLVPAPGCELWEGDLSQAEIRVATAIAKCTPMLRMLKQGVDSHDAATKLMFYADQELAAAKQLTTWGRHRDVSKRCNLGILYGSGVKTLRATIAKFTGIDYPDDLVRGWISDWRGAFPQFAQALDGYAELASTQGYVRLITGRTRPFSDWEPVHKAFNQVIQGSVAEVMKLAMIEFDQTYPGMLLLQIHDSLVAEIPKDQVAEVTGGMQDILRRNFDRYFAPVPFKTDVKPFGRGAYDNGIAA